MKECHIPSKNCIQPLVSILLPTRNRAGILTNCIKSVLQQTYPNWELVIFDDASNDETIEIVNTFISTNLNIHYHRNRVRQGLSETRNLAISSSLGDLIFFIEDDLALQPDCLTILVDTYFALTQKNIPTGAVAPRLIATQREPTGPLTKIFDYIGESRRKKMQSPCEVDKYTGIIYRNYDKDFNNIIEVMDVHACSLFSRPLIVQVGGYSNAFNTQNFILQESDLHFRLRKAGYKLFFQPRAITYHHEALNGGCSVGTQKWLTYYYLIRNQTIFLKRNYGVRAIYMIPLFLGYFVYSPIQFSAHWLIKKLWRGKSSQ